MRKSSFVLAFCLAVSVLVLVPLTVHAGTASATASSGRGGQNCGKISKKSRQNTGAMTVQGVKVNGTSLVEGRDYKVRAGTNGSTRPVIEFTNPLPANANVAVSLDTILDGSFTVNLELTTCK